MSRPINLIDYKQSVINYKLFREAKKFIPGGVNSPVRAFKAVGGYPIFIKKGWGSKIYSEDSRKFIDYCLSFGALILGHAHPQITKSLREVVKRGLTFGIPTKLETELAQLISEAIPSIEQVRLTNSGTEAVMSAVRLARGYTRKNKIIKFEGSYHGHADYLLVKGGSGQASLGVANSLGIPRDFIRHTIVLAYNNLKEVEKIAKRYAKDLAAIIVEPVAANSGVILPQPGFLEGLRRIADKYNLILIFDEVITGFRLSYGGAQKYFGVRPDLTCLGKILGGGLPLGAFGGRREIMQYLAPLGKVYQAGTLAGNPLAVSTAIATLNILKTNPPYRILEKKTKQFCQAIERKAKDYKLKFQINYIGSLFSIFFAKEKVVDYETAKMQDTNLFRKFFQGLLKGGIYFSPSGYEANFLSVTHTAKDIEETLKIIGQVFKNLRR